MGEGFGMEDEETGKRHRAKKRGGIRGMRYKNSLLSVTEHDVKIVL